MKRRNSWAVWLGCCLVGGCGVNSRSQAEEPVVRRAAVDLAPQISPEFPLDQDVAPEFNSHGTLHSVAASASAGYLLAFKFGYQHYEPEAWSRFLTHGNLGAYGTNHLELVRWDAVGGAPSVLTRLPKVSLDGSARVIGLSNGWLVVYDGDGGRSSTVVSPDGSSSPPISVPGTCAMVDFTRSATTALLTDSCLGGVLLDLAGHVLKTVTFALPPAPFVSHCDNPALSGGLVAFNGIDYLTLFSCSGNGLPTSVLGFPVSPAGDLATPIPVVDVPLVPDQGVTPLSIAGRSDGRFLAVVSEGQSSGARVAAYRTIDETAAHVFSVNSEHFLPDEGGGQASTQSATAFVRGSNFAILRERSNQDLDLVVPSATANGPDTSLPLPAMPYYSNRVVVSSSDPFAGGNGSFLLAAEGHGVRFDASAQALDVPAVGTLQLQRGQFAPSVAFDGQGFLAAWTEASRIVPSYSNSEAAPQIWGHRLSATGALVGAASFAISPATEVAVTPLVAANPGLFSAAWNGGLSFLTGAATITAADPASVTPYPAQAGPLDFGIATDGAHTAIAWTSQSSVQIAQLGSGGSWSTPLAVASNADPLASAPALAFNDGQYAVLWTATGNPGERVLYGTRVSAALTLIDATPKELLRFTSTDLNSLPADNGVEAIAAGDHFLVAWAEIVAGSEEIRVARLSSTLKLLDPGGVLVGTQAYPSVASTTQRVALDWDGTNVWLVWRDNEGGAHRPTASLRGRRFSDTLMPVDSESFLIASDLDEYSKVTLTRGAGDSSLVGYTRYLTNAGPYRVRARFLSASSFAGETPCGDASQCQSAACVAGHCSVETGAAGSGNIGIGGDSGESGGDSAGATAGGSSGSGEPASQSGDAGADGQQAAGSAGETATAGQAGVGGSSADSASCSCRVVGAGATNEHAPSLFGLLITLGSALFRRRKSARAQRRREYL